MEDRKQKVNQAFIENYIKELENQIQSVTSALARLQAKKNTPIESTEGRIKQHRETLNILRLKLEEFQLDSTKLPEDKQLKLNRTIQLITTQQAECTTTLDKLEFDLNEEARLLKQHESNIVSLTSQKNRLHIKEAQLYEDLKALKLQLPPDSPYHGPNTPRHKATYTPQDFRDYDAKVESYANDIWHNAGQIETEVRSIHCTSVLKNAYLEVKQEIPLPRNMMMIFSFLKPIMTAFYSCKRCFKKQTKV